MNLNEKPLGEWDTFIMWRASFRNKQWQRFFIDSFLKTNFDNFSRSSNIQRKFSNPVI